jgi:hypothetical protein
MPRAADAYAGEDKWLGWILAEHGHGPDWARVFGVDQATVSGSGPRSPPRLSMRWSRSCATGRRTASSAASR